MKELTEPTYEQPSEKIYTLFAVMSANQRGATLRSLLGSEHASQVWRCRRHLRHIHLHHLHLL